VSGGNAHQGEKYAQKFYLSYLSFKGEGDTGDRVTNYQKEKGK